MLQYTDIAANLCSRQFAKDLESVLMRAQAAGVTRMLVISSDLEECERVLALCRTYPDLLGAAAGIHPHLADAVPADFEKQLAGYLCQPQVKAAGEMGLDYNRNYSSVASQESVFEAQLSLATQAALPLFLHERDAGKRLRDIFRPWRTKIRGGVLHCFTGSSEDLDAYLDLGLYIGITGWICDERRGQLLQTLVSRIPDDRLLIETDAPYLVPRTLQTLPKRNEPAFLPEVARQVALCRGQQAEQIAAISQANAKRLFWPDE